MVSAKFPKSIDFTDAIAYVIVVVVVVVVVVDVVLIVIVVDLLACKFRIVEGRLNVSIIPNQTIVFQLIEILTPVAPPPPLPLEPSPPPPKPSWV